MAPVPCLRLLIVTQYFWPEAFPITDFVDALREAGCDVTVLTGQPNYPGPRTFPGYRAFAAGREMHATGYPINRVPVVPRGRATSLRLGLNYLSFVLSASLVGAWLLRGERFDVVFVYAPSPITQTIPAMLISRIKRASLALWVQDLWPESVASTGHLTNRRVLRMLEGMVRWIYRHCDLLLGQSRAFVTAIAPLAGSTPVEYFPNHGDPAFASGDAAGAALTLGPGFNVVFAGNLGTVQALETILAAAKLLLDEPDVRFFLIGSGSRSDWLDAEIERRALTNVRVPGRFPASAMPPILAQASVLLVNLKRSEIMSRTIPTKIQAYLAAGRPIIASLDGEGAQVVLEAGAGMAVPAEDAAALAGAVLRMRALSEPERRAMGASGRRYFEQHFHPRLLARMLTDRLAVLSGAQPPGAARVSS